MAYENTDDLCKNCGPTVTAFLEGMAAHNKEQMELKAKIACPTYREVEGISVGSPDTPLVTLPH